MNITHHFEYTMPRVRRNKLRYSDVLLLFLLIVSGLGPLLRYGDISAARILAVVLILSFFPLVRRIKGVSVLPLLFGCVYALSLTFNQLLFDGTIPVDAFLFFGYGLIASLLSRMTFCDKALKNLVFVFISIGVVAALSAIYEDITGFNWNTGEGILVLYGVDRANGLHGDPNSTADFILLGCMPSIYILLSKQYRLGLKFFSIAVIFICFWGLYTTASRGSLAALSLAILPFAMFRRRYFFRFFLVISLILVVFNLTFLLKGRELSFTVDGAGIARALTFRTNLQNFLDHPIIGNKFHDLAGDVGAHNNFLEILSHGGIFSGIPFILLHWFVFIRLRNNLHIEFNTLLLSLFLVIVGGGLSHTSYRNIIFWCIIGLSLNYNTTREQPARR